MPSWMNFFFVTLFVSAKFSKLSLYAVECFKNLAVDEVSIEEMIEEGSLEELLLFASCEVFAEYAQVFQAPSIR